ncbi:HAD family hydrolase [Suttonella sp. R2A3]|uniref:HAD family hydrolase n=1 Tax=Suttonella sp. R2A3 TaxID=2908648 RepID=UPI001F43DDBD|nr:HAD family hydrolase [Suttonella sp. R2A3]UJF24856.1 HAD family hydrolase [Suttonella sp. R2A3]
MLDIQAIAFDKDGTLFDSEQLYAMTLRAAFADMNVDFDEAMIGEFTGLAAAYSLAKLETFLGDASQVARFTTLWQANRDRLIAEQGIPLIDGAAQTIRACYEKGYPLALVTSDDYDGTLEDFARVDADLLPCFSVIVTVDDVAHAKPDPEPYQRAAAYLGVPIEHMLTVEDSIHGAQAALDAGAPIVLRGGSVRDSEIESRAIGRVENLKELLQWL